MSGFGYNVLGFGANASSAASLPSDDQFNRVSFLSHFDGANNGVNDAFDDSSSNNHTISNTITDNPHPLNLKYFVIFFNNSTYYAFCY